MARASAPLTVMVVPRRSRTTISLPSPLSLQTSLFPRGLKMDPSDLALTSFIFGRPELRPDEGVVLHRAELRLKGRLKPPGEIGHADAGALHSVFHGRQ